MAEETRLSVLSGRLDRVPKAPSRIVRIFISSTFADTKTERNFLYDTAFPFLTQWCQEKQLEFQVVDMRWGIRDEATDDHMTTELCLREILNCQQLSIGPNFMFFLGQRYGYREVRPSIKSSEFEILLTFTKDPSDADLLKEWYVRDDNAVPPVHLLLPVTNEVKNSWNDICKRLTSLLREAARKAADEGMISQRAMHEYYMSVTEAEIRAAVDRKSASDHSFGFIRSLHHLTDSLTEDPLAKKYCDTKNTGLDVEAKKLLDVFKVEYVPSQLSPDNIHYYDIDWTESGVDLKNPAHVRYLEQFCATFVSHCKALIEKALEKEKETPPISDSLYLEAANHAEFCNAKCKNFCGRKEILADIFSSLKKTEVVKPLVVHGVSGAGKTSIMAMIANKAHEVLGQKYVIITRFLGTTPESSSIAMVIQSICRQIIAVYDLDVKMAPVFNQFTELVDFFKLLLQKVSDNCNDRPLLILLDSLDQLASTHNAYQCRWLVRMCPPNVRIVMSTLPELHGILDNLKKIIVEEECFFPVKALPEDTMDEILDSWMGSINRRVTDHQRQCIQKAFSQCPHPIFLKLAFEQARYWHSYTEVDQDDIATTVQKAIWQLFERLKRKYGQKLVSHALGYIVAARDGLTQQELEDVLSLDDEVLDEIYQYHMPPNTSAVRIPALIWTRLKYELQEYMVDRQADGKIVSVLYHRQFQEAASAIYFSDPDVRKARHQLLAEYFEGKWSQGVKKQLHLTHLKGTFDADRTVPAQPLKYSQVYNYRKLNELPYHLLHAHNVQGLVEHVFGNFAFLDAICLAKSGRYLLDEVLMMMSYPDILGPELLRELDILLDTMRLTKPTLDYPHNDQYLAFEFLGRLSHLKEKYPICIKRLIEGAKQWYDKTPGLYLMPQRSCFPLPGEPLRTTLTGHKKNLHDMKVNEAGNLLATASEDGTVRVWELGTDQVIHVLKIPTAGQIRKVSFSPDEQWVVSSVFPDTIQVWSLKTGEPVLSIPGSYTDIAITHDSSQIVAACGQDLKIYDILTGQHLNTIHNDAGCFKEIFIMSDDKTVVAVSKISSHASDDEHLLSASEILASTDPEEVKIWSLESSGPCLCQVVENTQVESVIMNVGTRQVVVGDQSANITIAKIPTYDQETSSLEPVLHKCQTQNNSSVTALCVTRDGKTVYAGDSNGLVYAWDASNGELKQTIDVCGCAVTGLAVTEDSQYALCGTYDGAINVMDLATSAMVQSLKGQQAVVDKLILFGHLMITASSESMYIKLWDISTCYLAVKSPMFPCNDRLTMGNVTMTKDTVFYRGSAGEKGVYGARMWNSETGEEITLPLDIDSVGSVQCLEVCEDRQHIICGFKDGKVAMYSIGDGKQVCTFQHDHKSIALLQLHHDGKILVAKTSDSITMWDVATQECLKTWQNDDFESLTHFVITNDGDIIYADNATNRKTRGCSALMMLRQASDEPTVMKEFPSDNDERIAGLALTKDGSMIALSLNSDIVMLDGKTYEVIWKTLSSSMYKVSTPNAAGTCLGFTSDNKMLIAGMSSKNINLLSTKDGCVATSNFKNYIYSELIKIITTDDCFYGVTYIGQFIIFKIPSKIADSSDSVQHCRRSSLTAYAPDNAQPDVPVSSARDGGGADVPGTSTRDTEDEPAVPATTDGDTEEVAPSKGTKVCVAL